MSAYDIDDARSCAESLYMTRTVAAVDAVAGSAVADHRAERWAAERTRREASASGSIRYYQHVKGVKCDHARALERPSTSSDP
mgnify:CR=1 FL=1